MFGIFQIEANNNEQSNAIDSLDPIEKKILPLPCSKFIFEDKFRISDYIYNITFVLTVDDKKYSSFFSSFTDYPYCLIKNIEINDGDGTLLCDFSGSLLWCLIQTLSSPEKENYLLAAKQGIICLKHVLPFLADSSNGNTTWRVNINEIKYNWMISKYLENINNVLSNTGLYDNLNHNIINIYREQTPNFNVKINIKNCYIDNPRRDSLFNNNHLFKYVEKHYIELNHDCEKQLKLPFPYVLQFNWLIENPNRPGTFYDPSCKPMSEISIKYSFDIEKKLDHDECYILDKLTHNIPCLPSIAYYTYTFQTFDNFLEGKGFRKEAQSILDKEIRVISTLNLKKIDNLSIKITLSDHIPKHAPIHFWIDYQNSLAHLNGKRIK